LHDLGVADVASAGIEPQASADALAYCLSAASSTARGCLIPKHGVFILPPDGCLIAGSSRLALSASTGIDGGHTT
jgi:hypothetical protein